MVQKTNLLVVGASGFIGKNLLLRLIKREDIALTVTYRNLEFLGFLQANHLSGLKAIRLDMSLDTTQFDECIYLAPFMSDWFMTGYKGKRLTYFSSGAVYMGNRGDITSASIKPTIDYARQKFSSESVVRNSPTKNVIIRFFGAYGAYEIHRKLTRKLLDAYLNSERTFEVYGDGNNLIDAMYVDDAIRAIEQIIDCHDIEGTFDVCSGEHRSINKWVEDIGKILGWHFEITHTRENPEEYIEFYASTEGFKEAFSFAPEVNLESGIKNYLAWLKK